MVRTYCRGGVIISVVREYNNVRLQLMDRSRIQDEERARRQSWLLRNLGYGEWDGIEQIALYYMLKKHGSKLPNAIDYKEVAEEAIDRIIQGRRHVKWSFRGYTNNIERIKEDVVRCLFSTVDSLISHRIEDSHRTVSIDAEEEEEKFPTTYETPEEIAQYKEFEADLKRAAMDDLTKNVVETLIENPDMTSEEVARKLKVDTRKVQNAKRRLRRRYESLTRIRIKSFATRRLRGENP